MIRRAISVGAALLALSVGSACAPRTVPADTARRVPVDIALVPATSGPDLTVDLDTSPEVPAALRSAGTQVLVGDARLWNIHHGQRLVGALQLATLKARIDPRRADDRDQIVGQVLGSHTRQLLIGGLPVWSVIDDGSARQVFVWFGAHAFGVLQVKGDGINAGVLADDLIRKIASRPAWRALAPQDYQRKAAQ